jgi:hypothetical protein
VAHPIPDAALDDRLAIVGTSGSGKTYAAGTAVERLLKTGARVVIVDPLDVWWGLRLKSDGERAGFPVIVFGGSHGDLPITEQAGALIGETVAGMRESCIISLAGLGSKASERRFMLAFLEKLYRKATGEPFHVIFDEADLFAPQKSLEPQLQNLMEQIVRRGRVKGFIPWLITQRPAVLSKDVLSQADGLIAMKLTSSQDRDAIGAWIEGQADRADEKKMLARLPRLNRGEGVVWIPGRDILNEVKFPEKTTFDSSRTPKRGEAVRSTSLKPIDLSALKERLASVENEVSASDPKALKAKVAELQRELSKKTNGAVPIDPEMIARAERAAEERGRTLGYQEGYGEGWEAAFEALDRVRSAPPKSVAPLAPERPATAPLSIPRLGIRQTSNAPPPRAAPTVADGVSKPQQRILDALLWFERVGVAPASKDALAFLAGASSTSGGYFNNLGSLRSQGLIDYPSGGMVALTDPGRAMANEPDGIGTLSDLHDAVRQKIPAPMQKIFDEAIRVYPRTLSKDQLADRIGVSPTSGGYFNNLGRLRTLGLIDYPSPGLVQATPIMFPEGLQ